MPKTQYYTATTIDGYIADEFNSLDWLFEVRTEGHAADSGADRTGDGIPVCGARRFARHRAQ